MRPPSSHWQAINELQVMYFDEFEGKVIVTINQEE